MKQLLFERILEGGSLTEEKESQYSERLDEYWWKMTSEQQTLAETTLANEFKHIPETEEDLELQDQLVVLGKSSLPRNKI